MKLKMLIQKKTTGLFLQNGDVFVGMVAALIISTNDAMKKKSSKLAPRTTEKNHTLSGNCITRQSAF